MVPVLHDGHFRILPSNIRNDMVFWQMLVHAGPGAAEADDAEGETSGKLEQTRVSEMAVVCNPEVHFPISVGVRVRLPTQSAHPR